MTLRTLLAVQRGLLSAIALAVLSVVWQASAHLDRASSPLTREALSTGTPHRPAASREFRSARPLGDAPPLRSVMQPHAPSHGASSPMTLVPGHRAGA